MKTYVVKFWRNDGGWHSDDYKYNPYVCIQCKNKIELDEICKEIVKEHNQKYGYDFHVSKIYTIEECKEVIIKRLRALKKTDKYDLNMMVSIFDTIQDGALPLYREYVPIDVTKNEKLKDKKLTFIDF